MRYPDPFVLTLTSSDATLWYPVGSRVNVGWLSRRWYARAWRWLLKRNWRVRMVDYHEGQLTLERCR